MSLSDDARPPILEVEDLAVSYRQGRHYQSVVHGVSFSIAAGEVVALVGESGSGKTTIAQAVIGLLAENGRLDRGAIRLNGTDIAHWPEKRLDAVRGAKISLIPQDPGSSLNPVLTIGEQVGEILKIHGEGSKALKSRVIDLLMRVGLTEPELRATQYPHELSGGMRQRVLIAIAVALRPALIIADEPTSALDVTVQRRILDLMDELRREYGTAILLVTHDLAIAADRASKLIVLQGGHIREKGPAAEVVASPRHPYTRQLLSDVPSLAKARARPARPRREAPLDDAIAVEQLVQVFTNRGGRGGSFRALDGISFRVPRGTTHALVGESGSGKTTAVRNIVGLARPASGLVLVNGEDPAQLKADALRQFRRKVQLVYQSPFASLDPRQTVFRIVEEPLLNFERRGREERARKVETIIERVGLPQAVLERLPRALSGGQRQRVAIARAMVLDPEVLVLDEAVSALDVTVQSQILALLDELQKAYGLTYLFVSHDLAVVRQIADSVSVLRAGRIEETAAAEAIFANPSSPYTRELIAAVPGRGLAQNARAFLRECEPIAASGA